MFHYILAEKSNNTRNAVLVLLLLAFFTSEMHIDKNSCSDDYVCVLICYQRAVDDE